MSTVDGRLKTVVISLIVLLLCFTVFLVGMIILETITANIINIQAMSYDKVPFVFIVILAFLSLFAFIIGQTGLISGKFNSTWIRSIF